MYTNRRGFLRTVGAGLAGARLRAGGGSGAQRAGKPRCSEFVFARLRYDSGDWDYNPKVAANVLDSVVQYTRIPVFPDEVVISAASTLTATHPLYRSFFTFAGGPPQTSHELNGWGDNIVHEYLKGIERPSTSSGQGRGRIAVIYSNKDYGCEWDYDWRNKRFLREDNTKFAVNLVVYAMT